MITEKQRGPAIGIRGCGKLGFLAMTMLTIVSPYCQRHLGRIKRL